MRSTFRSLLKRPALGIRANSAIFSVIDTVRPCG